MLDIPSFSAVVAPHLVTCGFAVLGKYRLLTLAAGPASLVFVRGFGTCARDAVLLSQINDYEPLAQESLALLEQTGKDRVVQHVSRLQARAIIAERNPATGEVGVLFKSVISVAP